MYMIGVGNLNLMQTNKIHCGDALAMLRQMQDESVQCCITSPPYWGLRDYGIEGQYGLETTPDEYIQKMVELFAEVNRAQYIRIYDEMLKRMKDNRMLLPGTRKWIGEGEREQEQLPPAQEKEALPDMVTDIAGKMKVRK